MDRTIRMLFLDNTKEFRLTFMLGQTRHVLQVADSSRFWKVTKKGNCENICFEQEWRIINGRIINDRGNDWIFPMVKAWKNRKHWKGEYILKLPGYLPLRR